MRESDEERSVRGGVQTRTDEAVQSGREDQNHLWHKNKGGKIRRKISAILQIAGPFDLLLIVLNV